MVTAKDIADVNAQLAAEDAAKLAHYNATRSRTAGEVLSDTGVQLLQGAVGLGQAAYGVGNLATLGLLDRATGMSQNFRDTNDILNTWKSDPTRGQLQAAQQTFDKQGIAAGVGAYLTNPALLQDAIITNLPQLLPAAGAARYANAAGRAAVAAGASEEALALAGQQAAQRGVLLASGAQAGGSTNVDAINLIRENGGDADTQQWGGVGAGVLAGVATPIISKVTGAANIEAAAANALLNPQRAVTPGFIRTVAEATGKEALEETLQSGVQQVATNAFAPNVDITKGVGQQMAMGGLLGGLLGGGMGAVTYRGPAVKPSAESRQADAALNSLGTELGVGATPAPVAGVGTALVPNPQAMPTVTGEKGGELAKPALEGELLPPETQAQRTLPAPPPTAEAPRLGVYAPTAAPFTLYTTPEGSASFGAQYVAAGGADLLGDPIQTQRFTPSVEDAPVYDPTHDAQQAFDFNVYPMQDAASQFAGVQPRTGYQPMSPQEVAAQRATEAAAAVNPGAGLDTAAQIAAATDASGAKVKPLSAEDAALAAAFTPDGKGGYFRNADINGETTVDPAAAQPVTREQALAELPPATWESFLKRALGVTPAALRSKTAKEFLAAVDGAPVGDAAAIHSFVEANADGAGAFLGALQKHAAATPIGDTNEQSTAGTGVAGTERSADAGAATTSAGTASIPVAPAATEVDTTSAAGAGEPAASATDAGTSGGTGTVEAGSGEPDGGTGGQIGAGAGRADVTPQQAYLDKLTALEQAGTTNAGGVTRQINQAVKAGAISESEAISLRDVKGGPEKLAAFRKVLQDRMAAEATPQATQEQADEWRDVNTGFADDAAAQAKVQAKVDKQVSARVAGMQPDTTAAMRSNHVAAAFGDMLAETVNEDDYDTVFNAVKNNPEWAKLPPALQDKVLAVSPDWAGGKFRRGAKPASAIDSAKFDELVGTANRMTGRTSKDKDGNEILLDNHIRKYATVDEYRQANPGAFIFDDAKGVFDESGNIHLIAENITDAKDLAMTLAHERGHEGLAGLLGDKLTTVTNRLMANAAIRKRIEAKMKAEGLDRAVAGEEVLMEMHENGERLTGDVMGKLRSAIRGFFNKVLGLSDITVADADVDSLLDAVAKYRKGDVLQAGLADPEKYAALDGRLGRVDPAVSRIPRFSRALDDLDRVGTDAAPDKDLTTTAKDWTSSTLKNIGEAFKTGSVGRGLRSFLSLNDMYLKDGKKFDSESGANPFRDLKDNVDQKENAYNKLLTGEQQGVYRSPEYMREINAARDARNAALKSATDDAQRATANAAYDAAVAAAAKKHATTFRSTDIASEWSKLGKDQRTMLDALNQYGTYYKLFPDRGATEQHGYEKNSAYDAAERDAALPRLNALWNRLSPEAKRVYQLAQADMRTKWQQRFDALATELSATLGLDRSDPVQAKVFDEKFGNDIRNAMQRIESGPYSPLQRYGDYFVTVRNKDGSIEHFSAHDSKAEAEAAQRELKGRMSADQTSSLSLRQDFSYPLDAISKAKVDALTASVDGIPNIDDAQRARVKDALVEAYLHSLPNHSFMQHANKRKLVGGFSMDSMRAYNDYSNKAARTIAGLQYDGNISRNLAGMQESINERAKLGEDVTGLNAVMQGVRDQREAAQNTDRNVLTDKLTAASFVQMMTSPSQMFVNGMQTFLVALPRIAAQFGGVGKTSSAFKESMGAFVRSRGDMLGAKSVVTGDLRSVLNALHDNGKLDFSLAHEMAAIGRGDGNAIHGHWRTAMEWASAAMHRSEVFNRQVTAYTAAKLALDKGMSVEEATKYASDTIDETHFNYSQSNAPAAVQGPWKRMFFQFQKYRLAMLAMLHRDIQQAAFGTAEEKATARRTLAYMLTTQAALTGAAGTAVAPLAFAIADAFRDDDELLDSRTAFIQSVPQLVSHGILAGAIDPSRLETGSILPILGDRSYAPKDGTPQQTAQYYLTRFAGPSFGLVTNTYRGIAGAANGDAKEAINLLPTKALQDAAKAYTELDGVRTKNGAVYHEPSLWDSFGAAVGLRTGARLTAEEQRAAGFEATNHAKVTKQNILAKYALGVATGDDDMVDEAKAKVQSWNEAHPDMAIRAQDFARVVKSTKDTEQNFQNYGVAAARKPSQSVINELN